MEAAWMTEIKANKQGIKCVFITFINDIFFTSVGHYWILCL